MRGSPAGEADFREAVALAHRMGARAVELRATINLACLPAQQRGHHQARTMLAELYNWFTEGLDTVDLNEAKTLVEELKAPDGSCTTPLWYSWNADDRDR